VTHIPQREVQLPHFSLPFRFGGLRGGTVVNEQDSEDDVIDCVKLIVAYPVNSREDLPNFGIPDLVFKMKSKTNAIALSAAVLEWEPRSETVVTEKEIEDIYAQHYHIGVTTRGES
jgi:hypothetical protein